MSSPWMPQHEMGEPAKVGVLERLRPGPEPLYAGPPVIVPSPAAEGPRFLPVLLQFAKSPPRRIYIGGFFVGLALSAAIGAALYVLL